MYFQWSNAVETTAASRDMNTLTSRHINTPTPRSTGEQGDLTPDNVDTDVWSSQPHQLSSSLSHARGGPRPLPLSRAQVTHRGLHHIYHRHLIWKQTKKPYRITFHNIFLHFSVERFQLYVNFQAQTQSHPWWGQSVNSCCGPTSFPLFSVY